MKFMKWKFKIVIWIAVIIVFVNLPLWDFFLMEEYAYTNYDGSFFYSELSGSGLAIGERRYKVFLKEHPDKGKHDKNLYRTFTIRPWRFWQWREMIFTASGSRSFI